jgi:antitoxin component of MazEF toxin-antitoxin module
MTIIVQSSTEDVISLPARLMKLLNLREGEEIKTVIEGQTLRLTPLESFLSLRGVLQDDQEFDIAIEYLHRAWQEWTPPNTV